MTAKTKNRWLGGYRRREADGRETFVIERRVDKKRYHVSTRCHGERQALEQLQRFEANPDAYQPAGEVDDAPVRLTADLIDKFRTWQVDVRGNTTRHSYYVAKYLIDWMADLKGKDLRRVELGRDIIPALDKHEGANAHRIAALKALYKWLRTVRHVMTSAQDCTRDLLVPQSKTGKDTKKKAVAFDVVEQLINEMRQHYRDVLLFMACTGWHITETQRFVRDQRSQLIELNAEQMARDNCLAVAKTWHKGKVWTATPIRTQQHLEAARRMKARGTFPRTFNEELKRVAIALGGDPKTGAPLYFPLGVMRHSFSTWHAEGGAEVKQISVALDHKSEKTTREKYVDLDVPKSDLPAIEFDAPDKPAIH